jgi:two-component system sensor histidine kinase HydH
MDLVKLKGKLFFDVILLCALQLLVFTLYYYTVKITNLYIAAKNRARKAEKAAELGKFSTILAHEIKNPLSSMSGLIKYAISKSNHSEDSTNINVCLTKSIEEIERLNSIVNDFLTFGKPIVLETNKLNLKHIVERTLDLVKHDCSSKDVNINIWGDDFQINVDENKLLQVFVNLILNSIDASPNAESIDITIDSLSRTLVIKNKVISEKTPEIESLFDPFYSTKIKGSGLGLAISKKILELHNSTITVENVNPFIVKITFGGVSS